MSCTHTCTHTHKHTMIGICQRDKQINRKLCIAKVRKFEHKEKSVVLFKKKKNYKINVMSLSL